MGDAAPKTCIYPGCDRPAVPPHPLGGPQPSFCDLEEHNALTAHQERQRLERESRAREQRQQGGSVMADEAYRAVFLRVHPTGKMVLSLTTESDGEEARYAQLVAGELGVPALDVKVVPADEDRFGTGHGYNTSPSAQTPRRSQSAAGKILAKAQLLAGAALETLARLADLGERRVRVERRSVAGQDDRRPRAVRARHRRAPARGRGRPRRPDRLQGAPSRAWRRSRS